MLPNHILSNRGMERKIGLRIIINRTGSIRSMSSMSNSNSEQNNNKIRFCKVATTKDYKYDASTEEEYI